MTAVKKRGRHSSPWALRAAAFSRWPSSSCCLMFVARPYSRDKIACVRSCQNRRLSLGSCCSSGGMILGTGNSGLRSTSRLFSYTWRTRSVGSVLYGPG